LWLCRRQPEEVTGLDDYPLPPSWSGDARIETTVIKTPTINLLRYTAFVESHFRNPPPGPRDVT
jgi:hypothetical protein